MTEIVSHEGARVEIINVLDKPRVSLLHRFPRLSGKNFNALIGIDHALEMLLVDSLQLLDVEHCPSRREGRDVELHYGGEFNTTCARFANGTRRELCSLSRSARPG